MELPVTPNVELLATANIELPVAPNIKLPVAPNIDLLGAPNIELPGTPNIRCSISPEIEIISETSQPKRKYIFVESEPESSKGNDDPRSVIPTLIIVSWLTIGRKHNGIVKTLGCWRHVVCCEKSLCY